MHTPWEKWQGNIYSDKVMFDMIEARHAVIMVWSMIRVAVRTEPACIAERSLG